MAGSGVLPGQVLRAANGQLVHGLLSAGHQSVDVNTGSGDGQQANSGQNGEAAADVIGHHELLVALGVGQTLQSAAGLVGGGVDALLGALLAVLLLQHGLEDTEGNGGLGGGAGLGDDVDGEVAVADDLDQLQQGVGGQTVAGEVDVGSLLLLQVIVGRGQQLHNGAGAQIGTADADDHQNLRLLLDLLGSGLDAGELLLVIVAGQSHPAGEITAGAVMLRQHGSSLLQGILTGGGKVLRHKGSNLGQIEF